MISLNTMKSYLTLALLLQVGASVFTLYGMFFGSTTPLGIALYFVGTAFWFALSFHSKLWGLMPLNLGALFVLFTNLWKLL